MKGKIKLVSVTGNLVLVNERGRVVPRVWSGKQEQQDGGGTSLTAGLSCLWSQDGQPSHPTASCSKSAGAFLYAGIPRGSASAAGGASFETDVLCLCPLRVQLAQLCWKTLLQSLPSGAVMGSGRH